MNMSNTQVHSYVVGFLQHHYHHHHHHRPCNQRYIPTPLPTYHLSNLSTLQSHPWTAIDLIKLLPFCMHILLLSTLPTLQVYTYIHRYIYSTLQKSRVKYLRQHSDCLFLCMYSTLYMMNALYIPLLTFCVSSI